MAPTPFDLLGPLPEGTTVLEASAGTGKTFTIAGLVARYLAEGIAAMDELLVVSFSRDSTRELRQRVRERLVSARDGLSNPAAIPRDDHLLRHLADVEDAQVSVRRQRLEHALAVFDSATVTTTHGFCQQVLLALGTAGDYDTNAVLVENIFDLVAEVADDLYLRKWGVHNAPPPEIPYADFHRLAKDVAAIDPATHLLPDPGDVTGVPALRARIALKAREEADKRKRRLRLVDYDDMLLRLSRTLRDPVSGPVAQARLRNRYRVVLVDEFQDTDPVQWSILRDAFHGHRTLVLIGDPKQAIYGFRGADVHAYLDARDAARTVSTLPTNWRSDAVLLDGMAAVLSGASLGDPRIRVHDVQAAYAGRMVDASAPVRLRVLPRDGLALAYNGTAKVDEPREAVALDLAAEVVGLLSGGTKVRLHRDMVDKPPVPGDDQADPQDRPLEPGDIAVLVRTHDHAELIRSHLHAAQVPVVLTGRQSVFGTPAAQEWQLLLEALEQPHRTTRVRRLALSPLLGLTATGLAEAGDAYADDLALKLRVWAQVVEARGVAALFETVSLSTSMQQRILGQVGGERLLTDMRHIAQALHETALKGQLGLTALLTWLRRRRSEAKDEGGLERSRRLESDAAAVQVITVHTSKGLEFPVVMVPFAWDLFARKDPTTAAFHDEHDQRIRDVGGKDSPDWSAHAQKHRQEETDDQLRLTYVALTRAQSHLVLWWAPTTNTPNSPLHRLLLHDDPSVVAPWSIPVPDDATALAAFQRRAAASKGALVVDVIAARELVPWSQPASPSATLERALLERPLDAAWRRTSYTALTSSAHDQGSRLGSEPEVAPKDDEMDVDEALAASSTGDEALREVPSLWDALPGGANFGTLVHTALEKLGADDAEPLGEVVTSVVARYGPGTDAAALTSGLAAALATPLGRLTDEAALQEIPATDRLPELDFELPLVGGDEARAERVMLAELVPLWREHCASGPLSSYADVLEELDPAPLRGYLAGGIDAVVRVGDTASRRYLVVDYKTNRLAGREEPLTAWHYRPDALERAMIEAHYPLQALLYDVALHRYLRWRQPGYDPAVHLGGVLYLFLRGMSGPGVLGEDGSTPGVFSWCPPAGLVTDFSDLLAGTR
ncbi:MAG: UvrD-helicase domain-containing protein [Sporichthyaceae bacterium]|nr:UvrD-helicase domain-containing protein [Sporichthyaceae bacterium]